jgi:hypothetical protein
MAQNPLINAYFRLCSIVLHVESLVLLSNLRVIHLSLIPSYEQTAQHGKGLGKFDLILL